MSTMDLHNIWTTMGGQYHPSVICKVRGLTVDSAEIMSGSSMAGTTDVKQKLDIWALIDRYTAFVWSTTTMTILPVVPSLSGSKPVGSICAGEEDCCSDRQRSTSGYCCMTATVRGWTPLPTRSKRNSALRIRLSSCSRIGRHDGVHAVQDIQGIRTGSASHRFTRGYPHEGALCLQAQGILFCFRRRTQAGITQIAFVGLAVMLKLRGQAV